MLRGGAIVVMAYECEALLRSLEQGTVHQRLLSRFNIMIIK